MHYFGEKMHKTKVFLHKSENTLERDSDIIRIYAVSYTHLTLPTIA